MENSYDRLLCWFTFSEYLLDPKGPNISQKYDEIKKIIADLYKIGHKVDNDKVKVKEHKDRACECVCLFVFFLRKTTVIRFSSCYIIYKRRRKSQ